MVGLDFYKYIHKRKDKYHIMKENEWYGTYDDLRLALHDRDILIDSNWDMSEMLARDETPNKYDDMELPPFNYRRYITRKHDGHYMIRKVIDGEQIFFGQYPTLKEAMDKRDELIRCDWDENRIV